MREDYDFNATTMTEALGLSQEEFLACGKFLDTAYFTSLSFAEHVRNTEDILKANTNPVLTRFIAMLVACQVKEVNSKRADKVEDPNISIMTLQSVVKGLKNLKAMMKETVDLDQNIRKTPKKEGKRGVKMAKSTDIKRIFSRLGIPFTTIAKSRYGTFILRKEFFLAGKPDFITISAQIRGAGYRIIKAEDVWKGFDTRKPLAERSHHYVEFTESKEVN